MKKEKFKKQAGRIIFQKESGTLEDRVKDLETQVALLIQSQLEDDGAVTETKAVTDSRIQKLMFWKK